MDISYFKFSRYWFILLPLLAYSAAEGRATPASAPYSACCSDDSDKIPAFRETIPVPPPSIPRFPVSPDRIPHSPKIDSSSDDPLLYAQNYIWPTNASPYATASFGETRSAHFHAALDIKTWGRKGYEVYATRDGVLTRVGVYAIGYGNVVYLRHKDGTYSVYAHLQRFAPRIRRIVDSLRLASFQFEIDHIFRDRVIRFEQGEVIGYSGASGVGPPHLHFELRTANQEPFNPFLTNLSIPDDRSPRFQSIAVEPLGLESLVESSKRIYTRQPDYRSGMYDYGTIQVQGTVGLAVNVFDRANRVNNVYAVYELLLRHRTDTLFHSKVNRFSYAHTRQMFLDRVFPLLQKTGKGFQRLYIADGNKLPFYRTEVGSGKLDLSPGPHDFTIIAKDFFGNRRKATVTLQVTPPRPTSVTADPPPFYTQTISGHPPLSTRALERWTWQPNWIAYPSHPSFVPYLATTKSPDSYFSPEKRSDSRKVGNFVVIPLHDSKQVINSINGKGMRLQRVRPDTSVRIYSADSAVQAHFPRKTLYDTLSVGLRAEPSSPLPTQSIHIYPKNQPVRSPYTLHTDFPPEYRGIPARKWAFYRKTIGEKEVEFLPTRFTAGQLSAKTNKFGTYILQADTTQPEITDPRLFKTSYGEWRISVRTVDERAGVAFRKARMVVNGLRGIPEYDPYRKRLIYYHPDFTPQKKNKLTVYITDKRGNKQTEEFVIEN